MKAVELLERKVLSDELETASGSSGYVFNIAVVHQDTLTRSWAMRVVVADVIVVSFQAADELPLELYAWIDESHEIHDQRYDTYSHWGTNE
jgi:hypothetical protein